MGSEIAQFREQQELAEQAAVLGLSGYAVLSRHDIIERRMEQGAIYAKQLIETGRYEEAFALMETDDWLPVLPAKREGRSG